MLSTLLEELMKSKYYARSGEVKVHLRATDVEDAIVEVIRGGERFDPEQTFDIYRSGSNEVVAATVDVEC